MTHHHHSVDQLGTQHFFVVDALKDRVLQLSEATGSHASKVVSRHHIPATSPVVNEGTQLTSLKAGFMVSGVVSEVYPNGVSVDLHGLSADIYYQHLKSRVAVTVMDHHQMEGLAKLKEGQTVKGRIVSVCYSTRQMFLSTLLVVQNVAMEPALPAVGEVKEDGEVVSVDSGCGVMLKPNVYVHMNRMQDSRVESVERYFSLGMKNVKYRVIGYDLIDDVVLVHMLKSVRNV